MGAPTNYYVDPASGSDGSGDGSIGNPWATVQHALDNITRDSTNGDRINVKSNGQDTLSSNLDFSTYGTTSVSAPFFLEGYDSSQGDGGVGTINGGNTVETLSVTSLNNIVLKNMRFTNFSEGSSSIAAIINMNNNIKIMDCEIDGAPERGIQCESHIEIFNCYIHNVGLQGIFIQAGVVANNYLRDACRQFSSAIQIRNSDGIGTAIYGNIISLRGDGNGINTNTEGRDLTISHNSLYTEGTGIAIRIHDDAISETNAGWENFDITNNLMEGWLTGISIEDDPDGSLLFIGGNAEYNCTTGYDLSDVIFTEDNESLGSSPFQKSGLDHHANRASYFYPNNVGNVLSPYGDIHYAKGAVQAETSGTGSGPTPCLPVFNEIPKKKRRRRPMAFLREDTAVTITLGPFIDNTDGDTEETSLTIANTDVFLSKNGGAFAAKNDSGSCTHDRDGYYSCDLDVTDTNTAGILVVQCHKEGSALMVEREYQVVPSGIYDAMFGPPADLMTRVADTTLSRDVANVEDTAAEHSLTTLVLGSTEVTVTGGTGIKIYKTDGTTLYLEKIIESSALANNIVSIE